MKRVLPKELDDLSGMRAARWFRESTAGQWDNFGPDAQREQQDRAIERYALVDAGLEWSVAASGRTSAWRTATWEAMIGSATSGAFDVLIVGHVSRFLRAGVLTSPQDGQVPLALVGGVRTTPQLIPVEMVAKAIATDGRGERSRAYTFQISVTVLDGDGASIVSRASDVA